MKKNKYIILTLVVLLISYTDYAQGIHFSGYQFVKSDLVRITDNTVITNNGYGILSLKIENSAPSDLRALKYNITIEDVFGKRILKLKNIEKQILLPTGYSLFMEIQVFKDFPDFFANLSSDAKKEKENFHKIDESTSLKIIFTFREKIFKDSVEKSEETITYTLDKI